MFKFLHCDASSVYRDCPVFFLLLFKVPFLWKKKKKLLTINFNYSFETKDN